MTQSVLIYGGCGALGRKCVAIFKDSNYAVTSVDLFVNDHADFNVTTDPSKELAEQADSVTQALSVLHGPDHKYKAIICVAGGWVGGSAGSHDLAANLHAMEKQCEWSSVICAQLAARFLAANGVLTLTGASAALGPTPGMLAYGMVKAAVHQLTRSLAKDGSLPAETWVAAILPITLDTDMNRKNMPHADFSSWTPLEFVAKLLLHWTDGAAARPASGSLVEICTVNNATSTRIVHVDL